MAIAPRIAVVTIYPGDYLDRIRLLEQRAAAAFETEKSETRTLAEVPKYLELAEQHDALVEEAESLATHLTVQALPRRIWKQLLKDHQPRTGDDVDEGTQAADAKVGFNIDTFPDALVYGGHVTIDGQPVRYGSVINPDVDPLKTDDLDLYYRDDLDDLADIDFDRVYYTAYGLNRVPGTDPKASLVSQLTAKSVETSSEHEHSGSPSGDTEAGNPPELLA